MKPEKILEAVALYRRMFQRLHVRIEEYPEELLLKPPRNGLPHCHWMLDTIEQFVAKGRLDNAQRWLCFIQGVLWSHRSCTLSQLKSHNRAERECMGTLAGHSFLPWHWHEDKDVYERHCQIYGCKAVEHATELIPVGAEKLSKRTKASTCSVHRWGVWNDTSDRLRLFTTKYHYVRVCVVCGVSHHAQSLRNPVFI